MWPPHWPLHSKLPQLETPLVNVDREQFVPGCLVTQCPPLPIRPPCSVSYIQTTRGAAVWVGQTCRRVGRRAELRRCRRVMTSRRDEVRPV